MSRVAHVGAARGTRVGRGARRQGVGRVARGLQFPPEPFFEARAAEGVQAVEEGEGLVEDFGADLWGTDVSLYLCRLRAKPSAQSLVGANQVGVV